MEIGGATRDRTADLLRARQALSELTGLAHQLWPQQTLGDRINLLDSQLFNIVSLAGGSGWI